MKDFFVIVAKLFAITVLPWAFVAGAVVLMGDLLK